MGNFTKIITFYNLKEYTPGKTDKSEDSLPKSLNILTMDKILKPFGPQF